MEKIIDLSTRGWTLDSLDEMTAPCGGSLTGMIVCVLLVSFVGSFSTGIGAVHQRTITAYGVTGWYSTILLTLFFVFAVGFDVQGNGLTAID